MGRGRCGGPPPRPDAGTPSRKLGPRGGPHPSPAWPRRPPSQPAALRKLVPAARTRCSTRAPAPQLRGVWLSTPGPADFAPPYISAPFARPSYPSSPIWFLSLQPWAGAQTLAPHRTPVRGPDPQSGPGAPPFWVRAAGTPRFPMPGSEHSPPFITFPAYCGWHPFALPVQRPAQVVPPSHPLVETLPPNSLHPRETLLSTPWRRDFEPQ